MNDLRIQALSLAMDTSMSASAIAGVAAKTSPEAAAWAFTQKELRRVGRAKFERAAEMLFIREALEQATHERLAAYHASRFPDGELVADLTAGIGADLIALAARGPAVGFELDEERAEYARWNLGAALGTRNVERGTSGKTLETRNEERGTSDQRLGTRNGERGTGGAEGSRASEAEPLVPQVLCKDSLSADWGFDYAFADPSRRLAGRRLNDPGDYAPDPSELARRMRELKLGGIKLSPLLKDDYLESFDGDLEFVSLGGECREALIWLGQGAESGRHAVHVESGEKLAASGDPPQTDRPSEYLYEADPAAIRAHCLDTLCERHGLKPLGDSNGYLTGSEPLSTVWLRGFRVLSEPTGDIKHLKRQLKEYGRIEVKSRATKVMVEQLARELSGDGREVAYVIVYPVGKSRQYIVAKPAG